MARHALQLLQMPLLVGQEGMHLERVVAGAALRSGKAMVGSTKVPGERQAPGVVHEVFRCVVLRSPADGIVRGEVARGAGKQFPCVRVPGVVEALFRFDVQKGPGDLLRRKDRSTELGDAEVAIAPARRRRRFESVGDAYVPGWAAHNAVAASAIRRRRFVDEDLLAEEGAGLVERTCVERHATVGEVAVDARRLDLLVAMHIVRRDVDGVVAGAAGLVGVDRIPGIAHGSPGGIERLEDGVHDVLVRRSRRGDAGRSSDKCQGERKQYAESVEVHRRPPICRGSPSYPRSFQSMRPFAPWQSSHCSAFSFGATVWEIAQNMRVSVNP